MKNTLPNGAVIEGTIQQVNQMRKALGYSELNANDGVHYLSASKGLIRIDQMDEQHIRNAVRKLMTLGLQNIDTRKTNAAFLTDVHNVLGDVTLLGLLRRLQYLTSGRF